MAKRFAHAISVHYRDFEHTYVYWIWLRGSASYIIKQVHHLGSSSGHLLTGFCTQGGRHTPLDGIYSYHGFWAVLVRKRIINYVPFVFFRGSYST